VAERENVCHGAGYVLAAVDEVSEQDECVPRRVARQEFEELSELCAASVNVADDEGAHRASSAESWPLGVRLKNCHRGTETQRISNLEFQILERTGCLLLSVFCVLSLCLCASVANL